MGLTRRLHKGLLHFRPSGKRLPSGADFVDNLDSEPRSIVHQSDVTETQPTPCLESGDDKLLRQFLCL
jgi:hypothetical protein